MKMAIGLTLYVLMTSFPAIAGENPAIAGETANAESFKTKKFTFEVEGQKMDGVFDFPVDRKAMATVVIVHGYGKTDVVKRNSFYDLRSRFAKIGINTLVWDKPGCGDSEGTFDIDQPVQSSAREVLAAIRALRESGASGTDRIGLWGISRAGWIAPLAIAEASSIAFWISVSGTDDKENFRYLLESNLPLEGRSKQETRLLVSEWQHSFNLLWKGGTFEESQKASVNLDRDPFMKYMSGGGEDNSTDTEAAKEKFLALQNMFQSGELLVDKNEELMIYIPNFRQMLSKINIPVLAIFGEKDTNVDWRKTTQLYRETLGRNPKASLTIKTFPNANHVIKQCTTGGIREMNQKAWNNPHAEGYYETMLDWLVDLGFGKHPTTGSPAVDLLDTIE